VRVRRASDNHEQDFTASDVSSGALTSFVNAQVVAPLDIQALSATGRDGDFLIAKAAYSLRSLGTRQATLAATGDTVARADGKYVCQVRRSSDDALKSFTADEVTDGTLLAFVNEIQTIGTAVNGTGSVDNYTVSNLSTTGFSADNSAGGTGSAGFPYVFGDDDVIIVKYTVTNFSSTSSLSPQIRGVSATSSVNTVAGGGTAFTANGTYTDTLTATADGTHLMFADGNTGSYTISDFEIVSHSSNGFVKTWYDQSVTNQAGDTATGNHAVQATAASQPKIVSAGALVTVGVDFTDGKLMEFTSISAKTIVGVNQLTDTTNLSYLVGRTSEDKGVRTSGGLFLGADTGSGGTGDFNNSGGSTHVNGSQSSFSATSKNVYFGTATSGFSLTSLSTAFSASGTLRAWRGKIAEVIVYDTDQSDNRTALEANIGEVYSIDLPSGVDPGFDQVDGFVETWYDQSGNSKDAVQATAGSQPKIVNAGTLLNELDFDGTDDSLAIDFGADLSQPNSLFMVHQADSTSSSANEFFDRSGGSGDRTLLDQASSNYRMLSPSTADTGLAVTTDRTLVFALYNGSSSLLAKNGTASSAVNPGTQGINQNSTLGASASGTRFYDGSMQEFIIYNSDQSSKRAALETNIAAEYGITLS
jgi:hypothetical protein